MDDLQNPEFAAAYIKDAIDCNDIEGFLLAVRDLIDARGGMGKFSKEFGNIHRVSLYKALSRNGNPLFKTMIEILDCLGMKLIPCVKEPKKASKAVA